MKKTVKIFYNIGFGTQPVQRVVEVRKNCHQTLWISFCRVIPDDIKNGKHKMEGIKEVERSQKIVEAYLLFLEKNTNGQGISNDAKRSKHEHKHS